MCWKLFLENYGIKLTYVPGKNNILADASLCMPRMLAPTQGKNAEKGKIINFRTIEVPIDNDDVFIHKDTIKLPQLFPTLYYVTMRTPPYWNYL